MNSNIFPISLKEVPLHVFSDKDNGIKCILCNLADDSKLSEAVDTPKWWDAIQKNLDEIKKWV